MAVKIRIQMFSFFLRWGGTLYSPFQNLFFQLCLVSKKRNKAAPEHMLDDDAFEARRNQQYLRDFGLLKKDVVLMY